MEPEEALHWHILRRKKDGVEDQIDKAVDKIGAVPVLNDVLLPAMKEVGDKFGAGELILPFVLQSAEVMKRAVAQLEKYLDKIEGYTKGTVVLATVFGDVHDIGKSLVNTILTNNGYTVVDLGKQVPVGTIVDAAKEHDATAIGLSALLVSTSKQMPAAIQELHSQKLEYPVLIGGAAINRNFGRRVLYPGGQESEEIYEPGVFYCKDAFEGLGVMDQLVDGEAREQLIEKIRERGEGVPREGPRARGAADRRRHGALGRAHRRAGADAAVLGRARDRGAARRRLPAPGPARAVQAPLGRPRREGRGVGQAARRELPAAAQAHVEGEGRVHPRAALLGYFPCNSDGNELVIFDPEDHDKEIERLVFPRQPKHDRICLADFYRPIDSGERDVVALQAVTAGDEVTELMARLEKDGEFAEQLFVARPGRPDRRGHRRVAALRGPPRARHRARAGPPLLVGLPGLPGPVRAREGLQAAERQGHRPAPVGRLRRRAGAVDRRDRRPPPAGGLLRHEVRQAAEGPLARPADRRPAQARRPPRRRGRTVWFDDAADAYEESREEAVEEPVES